MHFHRSVEKEGYSRITNFFHEGIAIFDSVFSTSLNFPMFCVFMVLFQTNFIQFWQKHLTNAIDVDMTLKVLDAFSKLVVLEPHFFNFTCRFGGEIMQ